MYLSKVKLSWDQARNPYEQHRALWHLFPGRAEDQRDFLYRVERYAKGYGAELIVQSQSQPLPSDVLELVAVRELNFRLIQGQRLRFCLRANPIKTIKDDSKGERVKNGKIYTRTVRVPLIHEEQQKDWLIRKLGDCASLASLIVQKELPLDFRKRKEQSGGKIQPILFEGILMVENPDAMESLMRVGVGPAKSFGCGLLSLAAPDANWSPVT